MEQRMDGLFLVLEPSNHMFKVIEAAHRRGLAVVVCHSQPVAPPAPFAGAMSCVSHFVPVEGWRNDAAAFETIVAWCGDRPVRGTYAGFEITLGIQSRLRQHYGLPGEYPERMSFLLNKVCVRDALRKASLSKLRVIEDQALRRLTEWPFPGRSAFLKPVNGSGSFYVRRCSSLSDVREHFAEWDGNVRHVRRHVADHLHAGLGMFLEEEAVGELLSLEGYVHRGRYAAIGITDRTVLARDVAIEMGNTFPCPHPRRDEIIAKVRAIHECLQLTHGPTHVELIVPPDGGEIEFVELNLRFAGGDILILIDRAFDIRFEDDLVSLATGDGPLCTVPDKPRRYVSGQDFLAPATLSTFEAIDIPGDDVFFKKVVVAPGTVLKSTNFQSDHVAAFAVAADSYAAALTRANEVRAAATINGKRLGDDPNNVVINYAERWISPRSPVSAR
jgi:biotin carboxylase